MNIKKADGSNFVFDSGLVEYAMASNNAGNLFLKVAGDLVEVQGDRDTVAGQVAKDRARPCSIWTQGPEVPKMADAVTGAIVAADGKNAGVPARPADPYDLVDVKPAIVAEGLKVDP